MSAKDFLTVILFVALIALLPGTGYCTSVLQQDFSAYPSGTYLSDAGWTMAGGYCGNCTIQITDASGFGPDVNAVTGATAAGRCGFISAYRNFTSAVPSGNSLVLTSQIYIHPNLFWVWDGFWDGTVAGGDNGDPRGVFLIGDSSGGFYLEETSNEGGGAGFVTSYFGSDVTDGIYSVAIHLDASSQTAWAKIIAPGNQIYTSPTLDLALVGDTVASMTGVDLYVKNYQGGPPADFANFDVDASPVPEPLTLLAVGMGIAGLGGYIRRRRLAAK